MPSLRRLEALLIGLCDEVRVREAAALYDYYSPLGWKLRHRARMKLISACESTVRRGGDRKMRVAAAAGLRTSDVSHGPLDSRNMSETAGESEWAVDLARRLVATRLHGEGVGPELGLIHVYGAAGNLQGAIEVYRSASEAVLPHSMLHGHGVSEHFQLLNAVLLACARCADATAALEIYRDCARRRPGLPDAVSVNTLLAACEGSSSSSALAEGFQELQAAAEAGAADLRGVATLMGGCERQSLPRLAVRVHQWSGAAGLLEGASRRARGILLDGLFAALMPSDKAGAAHQEGGSAHHAGRRRLEDLDLLEEYGGEAVVAVYEGDYLGGDVGIGSDDGGGFGGGGGGGGGRGNGDSSSSLQGEGGVLGCRETLQYAQNVYDQACADGTQFDHTSARRCLLVLHTALTEFKHALGLLAEAEAEGALLAPSQEVGSVLLEHLDESPHLTDHMSEENGDAALLLFSNFVTQRNSEQWLHSAGASTLRLAREAAGSETLDLMIQAEEEGALAGRSSSSSSNSSRAAASSAVGGGSTTGGAAGGTTGGTTGSRAAKRRAGQRRQQQRQQQQPQDGTSGKTWEDGALIARLGATVRGS